MKQRILSLLLALALLCAVLPQITLPARAEDAYSGTCGDNLTWRFNKNTETLTIEGNGAMYNFWNGQPWSMHMDSINKIVFPSGLTSIGSCAFEGCTGLTSVAFPDGLSDIGDSAFADCTGLTSVTFPAGLTSIDSYAFLHCTGLTSVTFPDGLTEIENGAFGGCTGLTSITVPAGLTYISVQAFEGCTELTGFSVAAGNPNYSNDSCGVLFNKEKTELIIYPLGRSGSYAVPESVTSIGDVAFYGCTRLTSITLPDGLIEIGWSAFAHCTGLTSIIIPAGLISIGELAFQSCTGITDFSVATDNQNYSNDACGALFNKEKTKLIQYPCGRSGSYVFPKSVTSTGDCAFFNCTRLTSVTLPDGLTSIGDSAFCDCTGLTGVSLPDGLIAIGDRAFFGCTGLTSVVIPASVTQIDGYGFGFWYDYFDDDSVMFRSMPNFTVYGYKGTAGENYAQNNGFKFVPLDPQSGFADVKPKYYYYNAMLWALERGITSGTSRVTFSPNDTCTRGQVMTFLYAAKGKPEADWSNNPFVDVKKSKYYYKPVLWANQNGITNGVDDTHFQPNGGCTRAQVVTFLWALSGKPNPAEGSNPFKDVKKSSWYYKAVLWAYQNGVTSGVDDTHFGPNQTCTRGQVVTFLYALLGDK